MSETAVKKAIGIKRAGAHWLLRSMGKDATEFSDLGIRVANVLGQVFDGVFRIDYGVLERVDWQNNVIINVVVQGELATFDHSRLTLLLLCCEAAGIRATVKGSFSNHVVISFVNSDVVADDLPLYETEVFQVPEHLAVRYVNHVKVEECTPGVSAASVIANVEWQELRAVVLSAHASRIRIGLSGYGHNRLRITATRRNLSTTNIAEWHPTMDEHRGILELHVDIDYMSKES